MDIHLWILLSVGYITCLKFCQGMFSCDKRPCRHGGTCLQGTGGRYMCLCVDNYRGDNCEIYEGISKPCVEKPCLNGGVCFPGQGDGYACFCSGSYSGRNCEINKEESQASLNTSNPSSTMANQDHSDVIPSAAVNITDIPATENLNHTTLKMTQSPAQELQATEAESTEAPKQEESVTIILFKSWEFLVALLCFEIFAYCATLFIIFGLQNKRSGGKRFGTFSLKGRKGGDRPKAVVA